MSLMIFVTVWTLTVKFIRSAVVVDKLSDGQVLYTSDFCLQNTLCDEGTHTLCRFFMQKANRLINEISPHCYDLKGDVYMNEDYRPYILNLYNRLRGKVAMGKLRRKNGTKLPRGYGLYKLNWDSETATIAQAWAYNCVLREDTCRWTTKFSNPSQSVGQTIFNGDWKPLKNISLFSELNVTRAKVQYAMDKIFESWTDHKNSLTDDVIHKIPPWDSDVKHQNSYPFSVMVFSEATHLGCGISAGSATYIDKKNKAYDYRKIIMVCNVSHRPQVGKPLYNTKLPNQAHNNMKVMTPSKICSGQTRCLEQYKNETSQSENYYYSQSQCGCPEGTIETEECLCEILELKSSFSESSCEEGKDCNTVVLLPIFAEDPDTHTITRYELNNFFKRNSNEQLKDWEEMLTENSDTDRLHYGEVENISSKRRSSDRTESQNGQQRTSYAMTTVGYPHTTQHIPANEIRDIDENVDQQQSQRKSQLSKRGSIFSRAPKFQLYRSAAKPDSNILKLKNKPYVIKRRNFTNTLYIIDNYLKKRRYGLSDMVQNRSNATNIIKPRNDQFISHHIDKITTTTEADVKVIVEKPVNDRYRKLVMLLDVLEKEIQNTRVEDSEKPIIYAKIKNMYDTAASKYKDSLKPSLVEIKQNEKERESLFFDPIVSNIINNLHKNKQNAYKTDITVKDISYLKTDADISKEQIAYSPFGDNSIIHSHFNSDLSDGEFNTKKRAKDEEVISSPYKKYEFYKKEQIKPFIKYRDEIDIENRKQMSIIPIKEFEPQNYNTVFRKPFELHHLYNNDNNENGISKNNQYENFKGFDMGKQSSKPNLANNARAPKYTKYDTDLDYAEDPLNSEQRKYYQDKIDELTVKLNNPYTSRRRGDEIQQMISVIHQPMNTQKRTQELRPSQAKGFHL